MRRALVVASMIAMLGCGRGGYLDIPTEVSRCSAVDFLFVIDNSESMQPHQENLRRNFGPFIDGIQDSLEDVDSFHVGVTTTDRYATNPESCRHLGALVNRTPGVFPGSCGPFVEGHPYLTDADDLEAGFNCLADVGTHGSPGEAPMRAMTNALGVYSGSLFDTTPTDPWYDECNGDDFIRNDALLVAVVITDEAAGSDDPGESIENPDDWYDRVVAAKGREDNAVVVSLLNGAGTRCPAADDRFDGRNIADFTHRFTHGYVDGICERDYGAIFDVATEAVEEACEEYQTIIPNIGE